MTTLVVLSVVDIVLLIAGLAIYLYIVGGQLTLALACDRHALALRQLQVVPQLERARGAVEPWPEVRRG